MVLQLLRIKMPKKQYSKEEQEKIKRYHDTFEAKQELHKLMKRVIYTTGNGEESDDYTKTVSLDIGNGILYYDPYYQKLTYYDNTDGCEFDIEEDDLESVQSLINEIKKRFEDFQNKTKDIREKSVKESFDKPIDSILDNLR